MSYPHVDMEVDEAEEELDVERMDDISEIGIPNINFMNIEYMNLD